MTNHFSESIQCWRRVGCWERSDPNADTENRLELRVNLYYGRAEYKQKQKVKETKQAKAKLGKR